MTQKIDELWEKACHALQGTLSRDVYDRWIAVIEPRGVDGDVLHLMVANNFYQTWLEENYLPLIRDAVASVSGVEYDIKLLVDRHAVKLPQQDDAEPPPAATPAKRTSRRKKHPAPPLNANYNFDSFVVGSSNNFAHAASMAVARSPAKAYNPLFIYGGVGLGKTHLMHAVGNHILSLKKDRHVCYLSSEAFTNEYIEALQKKGLVQFRNKYRNCDLLLIDDIHFLGGKERMQEEFFHTFNALFDNHKQIVLTCDRPASEIPGLEQRLVSRFEWGLVTELESPDLETRIAILRNKSLQLNLTLQDEILQFIAENIRSNIRRLEGALIRAASYASLTGQALSVDVLQNLLRDTLDQAQAPEISMEAIQKLVAEHFDIRVGDMTSRKRPQSIALPRQVAMYLCRQKTRGSLPEIGQAFGRNHATVLHACRLVEKRMQQDPQFRHQVEAIHKRLPDAVV